MMYWSITCHARDKVRVPEAGQLLGPGLNVFTVAAGNLDELLDRLSADGVKVLSVNRLDALEAPDAPLLAGESDAGSPELP